MCRFTARFTTSKVYQVTNKVYNQQNITGYQQSVQPGKDTKMPTKCTTSKTYQDTNKVYKQENLPDYQRSVQPAKHICMYQDTNKVYNWENILIVGILVFFPDCELSCKSAHCLFSTVISSLPRPSTNA